MKTLLLDNFDSFTFNLYQMLAQVNGELPIVVHNDVSWDEVRGLEVDNVVISPGPGRPDRSADFGVCRRVIEEAEVPVLGVCLGHQGIGVVHGAELALAPEPMHGRASRIQHDASALFRGIPQGVEVVRYHSWILTELPASLERIAWTADGLVMACRHRARPLWGVQFHPESIGTEHGARLLANFRDLTRAHGPRRRSAGSATTGGASVLASAAAIARAPGPHAGRGGYALHVRELDACPDPERVFVDLYGNKAGSFWLDSSLEAPGSRVHVMGDAGGPLGAVVRYQARGQRLEIVRGHQRETRSESIFSYLARELAELGQPGAIEVAGGPPLPCDFSCGYVGYFGYELKAECGGDDAHQAATPDAWFVRADRVLLFDAGARRLYLVCLTERDAAAQARQWFDEVEARLAALRPLPPVRPLATAPRFGLVRERADYLADIESCLRQIRLGESYEVCLTNRITMDADVAPLDYYRVLRRANPAPYSAFLHLGDVCVACSSPERFLRVDRAGRVESRPIKGTLPRGRTAAEDAALRERLRASEKDRSEHLMIVDLVRNDLGRVCEIGTVHVPGLMEIESYATVHQMVSTIRGTLRPGVSAVDCVRAAFPGGSMTGAPKIRTMRIIDALEPGARGVYSGAIGWLGAGGAADLAIVIRTAVLEPRRATMGVGGAIVALSRPEAELDELLLKGQALMDAATQMAAPAGDPDSSG